MDKAPDAFRTISEVADELDVPQHVLRFWETRFAHIRPLKRGGGRRYYRPDDVDLLRGIRHLLYGEGYTIRGVQRILKDNGPKSVQAVWRTGAPQPAPASPEIEHADHPKPFAMAADQTSAGLGLDGEADEQMSSAEEDAGPAAALVLDDEEIGLAGSLALDAGPHHPVAVPPPPVRGDEAPPPSADAVLQHGAAPAPTRRGLSVQATGSETAYVRSGPRPAGPGHGARIAGLTAPQRTLATSSPPRAGEADPRRLAEAEASERQLIERLTAERQAAERHGAREKDAAERDAAARSQSERETNFRERFERLRAALVELRECKRLLEEARDEGSRSASA